MRTHSTIILFVTSLFLLSACVETSDPSLNHNPDGENPYVDINTPDSDNATPDNDADDADTSPGPDNETEEPHPDPVTCGDTEDCLPGKVCHNELCSTPCGESFCPYEAPHCGSDNRCASCLDNDHCGSGEVCSDGRCHTPCLEQNYCGPGHECSTESLCTPAACSEEEACDPDFVCIEGTCQPDDIACTPNSTTCSPNHQAIQICNNDGKGYTYTPCGSHLCMLEDGEPACTDPGCGRNTCLDDKTLGICTDGLLIPSTCPGNSTCDDSQCVCDEGWEGETCEIPICEDGCGEGACVAPNTCACRAGWEGGSCETPICEGGCGQGICDAPNTCVCDEGWEGETCETPICVEECGDNGRCVAPDTCECDPEYYGVLCQHHCPDIRIVVDNDSPGGPADPDALVPVQWDEQGRHCVSDWFPMHITRGPSEYVPLPFEMNEFRPTADARNRGILDALYIGTGGLPHVLMFTDLTESGYDFNSENCSYLSDDNWNNLSIRRLLDPDTGCPDTLPMELPTTDLLRIIHSDQGGTDTIDSPAVFDIEGRLRFYPE